LLAAVLLPPAVTAQAPAGKEAAVPWHVPPAELRFSVAPGPAWRAPVDVYLADLRPTAGQNLTFDQAAKAAVPRDLGTGAGGQPLRRVKGEAVFTVKPAYKWLVCRANGAVRVFAGKAELTSEGGLLDGFERRFLIPPETTALRIDADCEWLTGAGFLTAGPKVARITVCLPGQDPTRIVPLVYTDEGKLVGSVTLWAHPGEPLAVLFDCSAGRPRYYLYPVDQKADIRRPKWSPEAGVIVEARYMDRYDARVTTSAGLLALWKESGAVAGKLTVGEFLHGFLPFRPRLAETPSARNVPRGAPLALVRYVGYGRLPGAGEYRLHFRAWQGGFLVVDGEVAAELSPAEAAALLTAPNNAHKIVALKLAAGTHRIEVYQYGQHGQFTVSVGWSSKDHKVPRIIGQDFAVVEAAQPAAVVGLEGREPDRAVVSFVWPGPGDATGPECLGQWPADDLVTWPLTALASRGRGPAEGVTYRWRFDDGHTAEGPGIRHVFARIGPRQVTVEAVDAKTGQALARRAGVLHVQPRWDWPQGASFAREVADEVKKRSAEFAKVTPVEELLSLHAWARAARRADLREVLGAAVAGRLEQVLGRASADRLAVLGVALAEAEEQQYAAAEKVLRAALEKLPPGSHLKKVTALALADVLAGAEGNPKAALAVLTATAAEQPEIDWDPDWKIAPDPAYAADPVGTPLDRLTANLKWLAPDPKRPAGVNGKMPVRLTDPAAASLWLRKDVTFKAGRPQQPLVLDLGPAACTSPLGQAASALGMVWVNGTFLGELWRWPEGRVVVPEKLLKSGGETQVVLLLQAPTDLAFYPKGRAPAFEVHGPQRGQDLLPHFGQARADALARLGQLDEARKVLQALPGKAWPLEEADRLRVASQLRLIRRLAAGPPDDPENALDAINALLADYPLLRLDPAVMSARALAHLGRREFVKARLLAEQMLRLEDQPELTRREFLLVQVRAEAGLGNLKAAREVYERLTKVSPYSPETVRAREVILRAAGGR
jgi:hypothetical protein